MTQQTDNDLLAMGQDFFEWLRPQLSGWEPALISYQPKSYARIQLQSEPPDSEECGDIHCITQKTLVECVAACIEYGKQHPLRQIGGSHA